MYSHICTVTRKTQQRAELENLYICCVFYAIPFDMYIHIYVCSVTRKTQQGAELKNLCICCDFSSLLKTTPAIIPWNMRPKSCKLKPCNAKTSQLHSFLVKKCHK